MSWDPDWSLMGKRVSVDNRSDLTGISYSTGSSGTFQVAEMSCVVCVNLVQLPKAKAQSLETVSWFH